MIHLLINSNVQVRSRSRTSWKTSCSQVINRYSHFCGSLSGCSSVPLFVPSAKVTHVVFVLDFAHTGWTVSSAAPAATRLPQSHVFVRTAITGKKAAVTFSLTPSECCDSHLEINSEITSNIVYCKISVSQQTLWLTSSHLSLSSPVPSPSLPSLRLPLVPFPILSSLFYLYLFSSPTSSLPLSTSFLLTYPLFLCLSPPLSLARLLIPPLHPNLNSLKPSIRLHNKLLPLQARQGSSLPVAFCHCASAGVFVCVFSVY